MNLSRSRRLGAAVTTVLALTLAACGSGSDSEGDSTPDESSSSVEVEDGAFPVTIKHKFGETTIEKAPERVVAVGLTEQDALLALGVDPIAVTKWFGEADGFIFPWAEEALGDGKRPEVLVTDDGLQIEKIVSFNPDLIIGQYAGITEEEYKALSDIGPDGDKVPVVVQPEGVDYTVPWQQATETIGAAVGRPTAAKDLVAEVEAGIADYKTANPEFAGKTAVVLTPYEGIFFYGPNDPRSKILAELGFTYPAEAIADVDDSEFGSSVSAEQFSRWADVDVIVWLSDEATVDEALGGQWAASDAAAEGRGVFITEDDDDPYYVGHSFVTPLSIPYVLERYVPQLAAAADGDPTTAIPAPTA